MTKKAKPLESWATSTERVGYWQSTFGKYPHTCGVLFANGEWWLFPDWAPGMDRPVWLRTEAWLAQFMFHRHEALMDIGAALWAGKNHSEQALLRDKMLTTAAMTEYYAARARAMERRVMDDVFAVLTNTTIKPLTNAYAIRRDNPSPVKEP